MGEQGVKSLNVTVNELVGVAYLEITREDRKNALDAAFFDEFPKAIEGLDNNPDVRVIVLNGKGKHFCGGLELSVLGSQISHRAPLPKDEASSSSEVIEDDQGRVRENLRRRLKSLQLSITSVEECRKPVIAAITGACLGCGMDLISACDMRYCTEDAFFSINDIDQALVADLGVLQRIPRLLGLAPIAELVLTARRFYGPEAMQIGLVQGVFGNQEDLDRHVDAVAKDIAGKSPLATMGLKTMLIKGRDLSVVQGLELAASWNAAFLISADLKEALTAQIQRRKPRFAKL